MPPKKTIIVDREGLLRGIALAVKADLKAVEKELGPRPWYGLIGVLLADREELLEGWARYDLIRFVGRDLTASERIRHQEAIRDMEAGQLVEVDGLRATRIRLTPAGQARIKGKAKR